MITIVGMMYLIVGMISLFIMNVKAKQKSCTMVKYGEPSFGGGGKNNFSIINISL